MAPPQPVSPGRFPTDTQRERTLYCGRLVTSCMTAQPPPKPSASATIPCPSCGAAAAGRFCTQCGAVVREANCTACGVALTPGSKFCHECGTAVAAVAPQPRNAVRARAVAVAAPSRSTNLLWILA